MNLDGTTTVTFGFLATVGGIFIGAIKWLIGIKADVDRHTVQLDDIDKRIAQNSDLHLAINDKLASQGDQIARMETKLDLIIDKKIK